MPPTQSREAFATQYAAAACVLPVNVMPVADADDWGLSAVATSLKPRPPPS